MLRFDVIGTLGGVAFRAPVADASLTWAGGQIRVVNDALDETVMLSPAAGGAGRVASVTPHAGRHAVTVDGVAGGLVTDALSAARAAGAEGHSIRTFLRAEGGHVAAVEVMAQTLPSGATVLYAARPAGGGIAVFGLGANNALTPLQGVADSTAWPLAGVSSLAALQIGSQRFLFAGSLTEHGITALRINADGSLAPISAQTQATGLPVQSVTALRPVTVGGESYLIATAAASSSVTVLRVGADGAITVTDQLVDELGTRFAAASVIEVVQHQGRVFVVVAGGDHGVTLMTLLPGGSLQVLDVLADGLATGLSAVSALHAAVIGTEMQVIILSGAEAGATVLRVDLSSLGAVGNATAGDDVLRLGTAAGALSGGAGADILMDGAGADTLTGGAGADLFILHPDGQRDTITDFGPAQDRIDLSRWVFFRNAGQLHVTPHASGATVWFWSETLDLQAGRPLAVAEVLATVTSGSSRVLFDAVLASPADDPALPRVLAGSGAPDRLEGALGGDSITGGGGDDRLDGLAGDDSLSGGAGADTLSGGTGGDSLSGGDGGDSLSGGEGADTVSGDAGDDLLSGDEGNDALFGGDGADTLLGGTGDDTATGGAGDDLLLGEAGDDSLSGGDGNDSLSGGTGNDRLEGQGGRDSLSGDAGDDLAHGGADHDRIDGGDGSDTLFGEDGDDLLLGGAGEDALDGGRGRDTLDGGDGADTLRGGEGDDRLSGGRQADLILGGDGADGLSGDEGDDTLHGESGADTLAGQAGADILFGGDGDDALDGGAGDDILLGGAGNDTLADPFGWNRLMGGDGDDSLVGGAVGGIYLGEAGHDTITGGAGADRAAGGAGDDRLTGGAGRDSLYGGADDDALSGDGGGDWLTGGSGNDRLAGGAGQDRLRGGAGADLLIGGTGDDLLSGDEGEDRLLGGPGADILSGGAGDDLLIGGDGNDHLSGGPGSDTLSGGAGADSFVFRHWQPGDADHITDFEPGVDRLSLALSGLSPADVVIEAAPGGSLLRFAEVSVFLAGLTPDRIGAGDVLFL